MTVRTAIADAVTAAGIPGVQGVEWPPPSRPAGLVWASWAGSEHTQKMGTCILVDEEWNIILTLPAGDQATTGTARDLWLPALVDAIAPLGRLGRAEPTSVVTEDGGQAVPAVQITLHPFL